MDKILIKGGRPLKGRIRLSGAKNACLPILAATLLTDEKCTIKNVPNLRDINTMLRILKSLGVRVRSSDGTVTVEPKGYKGYIAPYKYVSTMRASICTLGPLLAKLGRARVSLPGGCVIGPRPINLHLKGLSLLGGKIGLDKGYILAEAKSLRGAQIYLGGHFGSSVLATANVLMAATLAKGKTIIENAACEPEIVDLANFLSKMGAKLEGQGSPTLRVTGVKSLGGATHTIIPDRIEAGTYIIAAAITGGELTLEDAIPEHLGAVIEKMEEAGVKIFRAKNKIRIKAKSALKPIDVTTLPFPGYPTDLQAQIMALMAVTPGISIITEKIYPERFMHIAELNRMGSNIIKEGSSAIVKGVKRLTGAPVMASDLRASAALVLGGLAARGETEISRVYHLDRGYERMEEKLSNVGADIRREKSK